MADPISVANLALSLLTKANDALNSVRERAKMSKDTDLKSHVSDLYDHILELKEAIHRLTDENKALKQQQVQHKAQAPTVRQVGDTNYVFDGDEGPFCQVCHAKNGKLVALLPLKPWSGGMRRDCPVCREVFWEKSFSSTPVRRAGRRGPNSWME
jgi:hypothetical protein